jgi:hypothetical protein
MRDLTRIEVKAIAQNLSAARVCSTAQQMPAGGKPAMSERTPWLRAIQ